MIGITTELFTQYHKDVSSIEQCSIHKVCMYMCITLKLQYEMTSFDLSLKIKLKMFRQWVAYWCFKDVGFYRKLAETVMNSGRNVVKISWLPKQQFVWPYWWIWIFLKIFCYNFVAFLFFHEGTTARFPALCSDYYNRSWTWICTCTSEIYCAEQT